MTDIPTKIDWNQIWVAMQELGAAMAPLLESGNVPDWAITMTDAMDEADPMIIERCTEAESNDG